MSAIVTLTDEQLALVRQGCDCASALSMDHGHAKQAQEFRDAKAAIPEPFFSEPRKVADQGWIESNIERRNERNQLVVAQTLFEMILRGKEDGRMVHELVKKYLAAYSVLH